MKRIIDKKTLKEFYKEHPDSKGSLLAWYRTVNESPYQTFNELRKTFPRADQVGRITVFNIKGNTYRLLTAIHYNTQVVYVLEVMTHAKYSKDNWKEKYKVYS